MNYWQTWLQIFSQTQSTAANNAANFNTQISKNFTSQYAAQWQQACQQWQSSMEGAWTSPASFWQAVASIQSARARFIAEFCQQQPQYLAQLFQCTSYPQLVECLSRWNGHTLTSITNLNMVTQAQRTNLMSEWKHDMPWTSNPKALANMWNANNFWKSTAAASPSFNNFGSTSSPKSQASATSASTAQAIAQNSGSTQNNAGSSSAQSTNTTSQTASTTAQPSAASHSTMTPVSQSTAATANSSISAHVTVPAPAPVAAQPVPSAQPEQFNLVSSTSTQTVAAQGTISSTANSVMRTSTGSTIAAAAARRSVVARRNSNTRRRASR